MSPTAVADEYAALLLPRPQGTTVSFFVEARDDGGRSAVYPPVAPDGLMSFDVRADTTAPELTRLLPARNASASHWPFSVRALARDDMTTPEVTLEWAVNGQPQAPVQLTREELCYWYEGSPGGSAQPGDLVTYRLVATDLASTPNHSRAPKYGQVYCPVTSGTELAIVNMSTRPCTGPVIARTLGELDVPYTYYEGWPSDWSAHGTWFICLGAYPDNYVLTSAQASDIVGALSGGDSVLLEGGSTWVGDPSATTLGPLFGVRPVSQSLMSEVEGTPGTILDGISIDYVYEYAALDVIDARGGDVIFTSHSGTKGRTVAYDAGSYRAIASSFPLGGLIDETWPGYRKEIVLRYLDYFGIGQVDLTVCGTGTLGTTVPVELESTPGDAYVLFASLGDFHLDLAGLGTLRLDPTVLTVANQGLVPPSGVASTPVPLPSGLGNSGYEIHFQALVGPQLLPGQAALSNRDILTLVE